MNKVYFINFEEFVILIFLDAYAAKILLIHANATEFWFLQFVPYVFRKMTKPGQSRKQKTLSLHFVNVLVEEQLINNYPFAILQ